VFTGAMNYFPNEQAALFFMPRNITFVAHVWTTNPDLGCWKKPDRQVRALHTGNEVIVTGTVTDVRPFLERASSLLCRFKHGSGTRLKILEAFAMGKAVVSTRIGAEGINAIEGRDILYADNASQFAAQFECAFWTTIGFARRLGNPGSSSLILSIRWPNIQQRLRDAYQRLQASTKRVRLLIAARRIAPVTSTSEVCSQAPVILHARCVTERAAGPRKTILNSPRFLTQMGYNCVCAYMHPRATQALASCRSGSRPPKLGSIGIPDRGPLDLSVVPQMARLCREHNVACGMDTIQEQCFGPNRRWWPMKLSYVHAGCSTRAARHFIMPSTKAA